LGVRTNRPDAKVLQRIALCLPPGWAPTTPSLVERLYSLWIRDEPRPGRMHGLYGPEERILEAVDLDLLYECLENEIQLFVGEQARERIFVHAGVVGWQGRAIVLPGRSMAGKSTLVAALLACGATYFSDEYAVFDQSGYVHPYGRRLCLRQPDGLPARRCTASELGGRTALEPAPVAVVASMRYQQASRWEPRPLSAGEAVLELTRHALPMLARPEETLAALRQGVRGSANFKGLRGDAQETAALLLDAVTKTNTR
jgi:hypothetical protein